MRMNVLAALTVLLISSATLQNAWGQVSIFPDTEVLVNEAESVRILCSPPNLTTTISWKMGDRILSDSTPGFSISTEPTGEGVLTVSSASSDLHTGNYTCTASLEGGTQETVADFTITVQFIGPVSVTVTTEECAEGVVYLNAMVTLDCVVLDALPPIDPNATQWFRDDTTPVPIAAEVNRVRFDGTRLVIERASSRDSADYFCRASNGPITRRSPETMNIGVITKAPPRQIELVFQGRPATGQEVLTKQGDRATINCLISPPFPAFGPGNVLWTRNSGGIRSNTNNITLFSSPSQPCNFTLVLTSAGANNQGFFRCRLDEGGTFTSASISLRLAAIPLMYSLTTTPPNTPTLGENGKISFWCIEDPPDQMSNVQETIRWEFISTEPGAVAVPVVDDGDRVVVGERTLNISGLRVSDSGTFVCVADHELVNPVRTSLDFAVEASLPVSVTPQLPMVRLGTPLTLTCTVQSERPANFIWSIDNTTVTPSGRLVVTSIASQSTLLITSLERANLGTISCTVSDPLHPPLVNSTVVMETDELYLLGDRTEETLNLPEGAPLTLECPIRARSESTVVSWFAGSRQLRDGENGVQFRIYGNGSSEVSLGGVASLDDDDGDRYLCQVTDTMDETIELRYEIELFITIPGNIISFPPSIVNATLGRSLRLDCEVSGRPMPRIMWFWGLQGLVNQSNPSITDIGNGSLAFQNVSLEDAGTYSCVIMMPPVQRSTVLRVEKESNQGSSNQGSSEGLNRDETILVFVMVGLVGLFLLLMLSLLLVLCCCCLLDSLSRGKYMVSKAAERYDTGSIKHNPGRKDNSDILMGKATPIFETLQRSPEPQFVDPMERHVMLADSANLHTFQMGSASLLTDSQPASPMRGTMVTTPSHTSVSSPLHDTDMFSSEGHTTSLENGQLPNFPRMNVRLDELMGQGEFGPVMKAVAKNLVPGEAETEVAVKLLVTEAVEDTGFRADLAMVDYASHMKLRYQSIAAILGICSDKEPYYVMYEYLDKGDLKNFLLSSRPEEGSPPKLMDHELLRMIGQVADGMAYLFSQRIIHGDIATRNCLVSSTLQVKIGDLGIGHELYTGDYYDNGAQLLPIRWMPPELMVESEEGPSFSLHSDTWSFGVFCWEVMAFGRLPYDNYSDEDVLAMVPAGSRLRSPGPDCPPALYLVMMECWEEVPDARPQFSRILSTIATINLEEM